MNVIYRAQIEYKSLGTNQYASSYSQISHYRERNQKKVTQDMKVGSLSFILKLILL